MRRTVACGTTVHTVHVSTVTVRFVRASGETVEHELRKERIDSSFSVRFVQGATKE